jgi:hypothetical protein
MESNRPSIISADTMNPLRQLGQHDLADDFVTVLLMMSVKEHSDSNADQ